MSFFNSIRNNNICPGPISGNPARGLCERACISVKKVFDACVNQQELNNALLTLANFQPPAPPLPLAFISGGSNILIPATVTNIIIERILERPNFARVTCDIVIPLHVTYTDANGSVGEADSVVTIHEDVIMFVPGESIVPARVEAFASATLLNATFNGAAQLICDVCATAILKIVAEVELLVPTYGYCPLPPCTEFVAVNECAGLFNLPLFPNA